MKLIKKLSEMIEDELDGAECYAKMALEYKDSNQELSRVMYNLSMQEMEHMNSLHYFVTEVIEKYRDEHGDPPSEMQAVYNYLHSKHIDHAAKIKAMQAMYKS